MVLSHFSGTFCTELFLCKYFILLLMLVERFWCAVLKDCGEGEQREGIIVRFVEEERRFSGL